MSTSVVKIYNQALSACGSISTLESVDENVPEAETCNLWYEDVRDKIFQSAPWHKLTRAARLSLVAERDPDLAWTIADPVPGNQFAYGLPSDLIRPRYLYNYGQFRDGTTPSGQNVIWTNTESPILFYTRRENDPNQWDPMLRSAIVFGLAAHIAMRVTGKPAIVQANYNLAMQEIDAARVADANRHQTMVSDFIPDSLQARGYAWSQQYRYIYPSLDFQLAASPYGS